MMSGNGRSAEPFVVGGDDVPGRPFGAGMVEAVLKGGLVFVPMTTFFNVGCSELPVFLWRIQASHEPFFFALLWRG